MGTHQFPLAQAVGAVTFTVAVAALPMPEMT